MTDKRIKNKKIVALGLIVLAAAIFYFTIDPRGAELVPKCMFKVATGLDCPGCGSQRALYFLLHGEILSCIVENPLIILFLPYIGLAIYLEYFGGRDKFPRLRSILMGRRAIWIIFAVIIVFGIVRNVI